ncbi:MAG: GAF domain-containing protein [Chloroflexota bacterium]
MPPNNRQPLPDAASSFQTRVIPVVVLIYLMAALGVFLVAPLLYLSDTRTPFLGAFIEHTLVINTSRSITPGAWGDALDLPFGYQVRSLDGAPLSSLAELRQALRGYPPGRVITLDLAGPDGRMLQVQVALGRLPAVDRLAYFGIPYFTGLIYLLCGFYVFGIRRSDPAGRAFAAFAASAAISLATLFDLNTTNQLTLVWTLALAVTGGALVNLALLFPEPIRLVTRRPYLGWIGYLVTLALVVIALPAIYNMADPLAYVGAWRLLYLYLALALFLFLGLSGYRRRTAVSPVVREQAGLIFWGAVVSFVPLALWLVATVIYPGFLFSPILLVWLSVFPLFTGYAIIRYRLLRTDFLVSRTLLYGLLAGMVMVGYALVVSGASLLFGGLVQAANPLLVGLVVFLIAIGLGPLRGRLQALIDRYFFRGQIVYRETQQAFGRELTQVMELGAIVRLLRRYVDQAFAPSDLHVFVFDLLSGHYTAADDEKGRPSSDIRFPANSALVQALGRQRQALYLADLADLPAALQPEQARLSLLAASLFVPLPGRSQLIGWLALGPRRSGEPYTSRDLAFLEALSDQAALAVERAQVVADLERRVREMNALTRVSQGVSFTVSFDDILELVATQTNQILPARDFRVTLLDQETQLLVHAFYLENDERLSDRENKPLQMGMGLEAEVIAGQRAIVTDDYERECRSRGLLPSIQGVYAWMGVPLNAGAQTIGALSIASREPADIYTDEQRSLLQAIADQTSGAIVKARSLEESERRARQLAKLNDIGVGLTSTLDLKPLLNQILDSAVDIINCEAGSLFLVDPQTDELVFEVVLGPVAANLLGRRMPKDKGIVGQAVTSGRPVIANDAKRRKEWFEKTDEQTGFDTQDLLVAPMRIQDRVIGVIEVINKQNGAAFSRADQELLMAFTSQATIAIENARLYTMTDQALAARVEELSVMQRIDRELNASLDIERAMRITLDWALRQSKAEAGLVGAVHPDGVRVMVAQGYTDELEPFPQAENSEHRLLPRDLPPLQQVIGSGQPLCLELAPPNGGAPAGAAPSGGALDDTSPGRRSLLENARQQIVIPIRRETGVEGVLVLESTHDQQNSQDLVSFLTRLSDHAAIAIANARLFDEVQEANLAKSRFVSFVAHELKNPMASIKGYTELVAQGMAGPVNEMQSSFLGTVKSNVDRMNTIVSDLNDLTKIQTGNMHLEYRAVVVREVLDEVIRSIHRQVEEKKQTLALEIPADLPAAWADSVRLSQVLTNLVSNAHKYTPESGRFTVGAELFQGQDGSVAAGQGSGAKFIHLWVKDEGIGISEADQKRIFQQYFRTDNAKEMASGTGLGLSITRSLVEMQGGRIWFDSRLNSGTTFHFTLPAAEAQ